MCTTRDIHINNNIHIVDINIACSHIYVLTVYAMTVYVATVSSNKQKNRLIRYECEMVDEIQ